MTHKYKVGTKVDFKDSDRHGNKFDGTGAIESHLDDNWYLIINEKCEPQMVCEVPEEDIIRSVTPINRSNLLPLILSVISLLAIILPFLNGIRDPLFLGLACLVCLIIGAISFTLFLKRSK